MISLCICVYFCKVNLRDEEEERRRRRRRPTLGNRLAVFLFKASELVLQPAEECRHESAFIVEHRAAVDYQQQTSLRN